MCSAGLPYTCFPLSVICVAAGLPARFYACLLYTSKQVQYELADKTEASGIDFRWQLPEERMPLVLDGQKT